MYRNKKLLELLRQLPCQNCGIENGTIVACHSNQSKHGKGMGIKAADSRVAALCSTCHNELDNGRKLSKEERVHLWDQAYIKTMQYLVEHEMLIINDKN